MSVEKPQQISAVKECEERYPETTSEFKKILKEQYELFCKKQLNYGPDNISVGTRLETEEELRLSQNMVNELKSIWGIDTVVRQNSKQTNESYYLFLKEIKDAEIIG